MSGNDDFGDSKGIWGVAGSNLNHDVQLVAGLCATTSTDVRAGSELRRLRDALAGYWATPFEYVEDEDEEHVDDDDDEVAEVLEIAEVHQDKCTVVVQPLDKWGSMVAQVFEVDPRTGEQQLVKRVETPLPLPTSTVVSIPPGAGILNMNPDQAEEQRRDSGFFGDDVKEVPFGEELKTIFIPVVPPKDGGSFRATITPESWKDAATIRASQLPQARTPKFTPTPPPPHSADAVVMALDPGLATSLQKNHEAVQQMPQWEREAFVSPTGRTDTAPSPQWTRPGENVRQYADTVLLEAAETFGRYAEHHRQKGDILKAHANAQMQIRCIEANRTGWSAKASAFSPQWSELNFVLSDDYMKTAAGVDPHKGLRAAREIVKTVLTDASDPALKRETMRQQVVKALEDEIAQLREANSAAEGRADARHEMFEQGRAKTQSQPLTFGELSVGERFIAFPNDGDDSGHGGFRKGAYLFEKTADKPGVGKRLWDHIDTDWRDTMPVYRVLTTASAPASKIDAADARVLAFAHDRFLHVYGEPSDVDFMQAFRRVCEKLGLTINVSESVAVLDAAGKTVLERKPMHEALIEMTQKYVETEELLTKAVRNAEVDDRERLAAIANYQHRVDALEAQLLALEKALDTERSLTKRAEERAKKAEDASWRATQALSAETSRE